MFPAFLAQLMVLQTAVPFVLDRLTQYLQPIFILTSLLLLQPKGPVVLQALLWSSVALGFGCMLVDTYNAGATWVPLMAGNDSYAVITG
jgi:hypothetical protein